MAMQAFQGGQGRFVATVSGPLNPQCPLDPFDSLGGSLALGSRITGSFQVADTGYWCELMTATQILGRSDGIPGLINIELVFDGTTFVQQDTCFNQVTYISAGAEGRYGTQEMNANNVVDTGQTTQTILELSLQNPINGAVLKELVDTAYVSKKGWLQFFAFDSRTIAGGFIAAISEATYDGLTSNQKSDDPSRRRVIGHPATRPPPTRPLSSAPRTPHAPPAPPR